MISLTTRSQFVALSCHSSLFHHTTRSYGILELQEKYGPRFRKVQALNKHDATPLERKMYAFANRVAKSPKFSQEMLVSTKNEIVGAEQKTKPNMEKIVSEHYNWNPYNVQGQRNTRVPDGLPNVPEEYRQGGFGLQQAPRTNTNDIYKMFPNTEVIKHIVGGQDMRVTELGHLLTNPLKELGYRDHNVAQGRDYNVMERTISQFSDDVVETWHGPKPIEMQQERLPPQTMKERGEKIKQSTVEQVLMRRLRRQAEDYHEKVISLPPFKYGFENVPIIVRQVNYHSPDMLGDPKRTHENESESNGNNNNSEAIAKQREEWIEEVKVLRERRLSHLNRLKSKLHFGENKNVRNYRRFKVYKNWPVRLSFDPKPDFEWHARDAKGNIDFATKDDLFKLVKDYKETLEKLENMENLEEMHGTREGLERSEDKSIMSYAHHLACLMIGGKRYNPVTTEFRLTCNDNYFYVDNERKVVNLFSKLIVEVDRLAKCIDVNTKNFKNIKTWEDYKQLYEEDWRVERLRRKWRKHRWQQEMFALPEHVRSNHNLYQSGPRMRKMANYLDSMYSNFVDAGNIIQREGPRHHNSFKNIEQYFPKNDETMLENVDKFPHEASNYCIEHRDAKLGYKPKQFAYYNNNWERNQNVGAKPFDLEYFECNRNSDPSLQELLPNVEDEHNVGKRKKKLNPAERKRLEDSRKLAAFDAKDGKNATFGLRSSYMIPHTEVSEYLGDWHVPLAQPFSGLRLRYNQRLSPSTNPYFMKLYKNRKITKLAKKLIFGNPQNAAEQLKLNDVTDVNANKTDSTMRLSRWQRKDRAARSKMTTGNKRRKAKYKKFTDKVELANLRRKEKRARLIKEHGPRKNAFRGFWKNEQKEAIDRAKGTHKASDVST